MENKEEMLKIERSIGYILRIGVIVSATIILIGMILLFFQPATDQVPMSSGINLCICEGKGLFVCFHYDHCADCLNYRYEFWFSQKINSKKSDEQYMLVGFLLAFP